MVYFCSRHAHRSPGQLTSCSMSPPTGRQPSPRTQYVLSQSNCTPTSFPLACPPSNSQVPITVTAPYKPRTQFTAPYTHLGAPAFSSCFVNYQQLAPACNVPQLPTVSSLIEPCTTTCSKSVHSRLVTSRLHLGLWTQTTPTSAVSLLIQLLPTAPMLLYQPHSSLGYK